MKKDKVAIFGGTFDPPHMGHYNMALRSLNLVADRVVFVPVPNVNRSTPVDIRIEMVSLMAHGVNGFDVLADDTGIGTNFSETIRSFAQYSEIYIIAGLDSVNEVKNTGFSKLLNVVSMVLFPRNKLSFGVVDKLWSGSDYPLKVVCMPGASMNISSTVIRAKFSANEHLSVKKHLHPFVYDYILDRKLYV